MRILITGSNGLLGQAVSKMFLRETDHEIFVTSAEDQPYIYDKCEYRTLDITRKDDLKKAALEYSPNVIINCAAFTNVDACETERELSWKINVDGVKNLIIAARMCESSIVHFSTDYVFDGRSGPYSEDDIPNPISFYGREKLASENALKTSEIQHAIVRTLVIYGTGIKVKSNFALWLIDKLGKNEPVNIVTDQISNVTMVEDLALGTLRIVERKCTGIYNIAGSDILSRYDFALKLCDIFGYDKDLVKPLTTDMLNQPAPRPLRSGLTTYKAESELGFRPMDSFEGLSLLKIQLGL
jgi:dTDP-4-dehydrorhamnose reductase